jgi:alanine-glyoxylate transaminase/serine-glyoxylate transaminase/serine-pyruvate transaminase
MNAYESRKGMYFATPPVQLIYGLNTSLKQITSTSLEKRFEQHKEASNMVKNAVESLRLKFVNIYLHFYYYLFYLIFFFCFD